jgi:hypothetical protein
VVVKGPYLLAATRKDRQCGIRSGRAYLKAIYTSIYNIYIKLLSLARAWWRHSPKIPFAPF